MKKLLTKRLSVATLSALMLASSCPVYAGAVNDGAGSTDADAVPVKPEDNIPLNVVFPTSSMSKGIMDFQLDPSNRIKSNLVKVDDVLEFEQPGSSTPLKVPVGKDNYQDGTRLYFYRWDYNQMLLGRDVYASAYWGDVKNVTATEEGTKLYYGNVSDWLTVTNKSAVPVGVQIKWTWTKPENVELVSSMKAINDSVLIGATENPKLYMAIEEASGYTKKFTPNQDADKRDYDVIGQQIMQDAAGNPVKWDADNGEWVTCDASAAPLSLDILNKVRLDEPLNALTSLHSTTDGEYKGSIFGTIPTLYQGFEPLQQFAAREWVATLPDTVASVLEKHPYYMEKKGDKILIRDNTKVGDKAYENLASNTIPTYPTYAFRLTGECNTSTGWYSLDGDLSLNLAWNITAYHGGVSTTEEDDRIDDLDIKGVIDNEWFTTVTIANRNSSKKTITNVTWKNGDVEENLLNVPVDTSGWTNPGEQSSSVYVWVDGNKGENSTMQVHLNQMLLHNLSWNGLFKNDNRVTLTVWFSDGSHKSFTVRDSKDQK